MTLFQTVKKIGTNRMMKTDALFEFSIDKQKKILRDLPEPKSALERSYFQYKCQIKRMKKIDVFLQNMGSVILLIYYLFSIKQSNSNSLDYKTLTKRVIFFKNGLSDTIIPSSIKKEYTQIIQCNYEDCFRLSTHDYRRIFKVLCQYPFSPMFTFKILIRMAAYRAQIDVFRPQAIMVSSEYSYVSSYMTEYLEDLGIEHINIMHGEKLFTISDAFVRFSRFYVWDEHYVKLFRKLRAGENQFVIERPACLEFAVSKVKKNIYLKYYLGDESEGDLKKIALILRQLKVLGKRVVIRPHPRFSDLQLVKQIFYDFEIENVKTNIEKSVLETEYVVALFSTVLYQAYCNNVKFVIDDCTNSEKFIKLKRMDYICFDKKYMCLSQILSMEQTKQKR